MAGSAGSNIGGFVGNISNGTLSRNYAIGDASTGGFGGASSGGTISNCFYDVTIGGPNNGIGTAQSTGNMQLEATFNPPWSFPATWQIDEGNDYHFLSWE